MAKPRWQQEEPREKPFRTFAESDLERLREAHRRLRAVRLMVMELAEEHRNCPLGTELDRMVYRLGLEEHELEKLSRGI
jgi:hypothetical protein